MGSGVLTSGVTEDCVNRFVRRLAFGVMTLGLVAVSSPVFAQMPVDVGVGYQYLHAPDEDFKAGLNLDVSARLYGNIMRVVAVYDWSKNSDYFQFNTNAHSASSVAAGLRFASHTLGFAPYLQVLSGVQRDSYSGNTPEFDFSNSTLMMELGSGVVFPVGGIIGVFGEGDYRRVFYDVDPANEFSLVAGIRIGR